MKRSIFKEMIYRVELYCIPIEDRLTEVELEEKPINELQEYFDKWYQIFKELDIEPV